MDPTATGCIMLNVHAADQLIDTMAKRNNEIANLELEFFSLNTEWKKCWGKIRLKIGLPCTVKRLCIADKSAQGIGAESKQTLQHAYAEDHRTYVT
jgi:hypothetical protein